MPSSSTKILPSPQLNRQQRLKAITDKAGDISPKKVSAALKKVQAAARRKYLAEKAEKVAREKKEALALKRAEAEAMRPENLLASLRRLRHNLDALDERIDKLDVGMVAYLSRAEAAVGTKFTLELSGRIAALHQRLDEVEKQAFKPWWSKWS